MSQPRFSPTPPWRSSDEIAEVLEHRVRKAVRRFEVAARGLTDRTCPICGYSGRFSPVRAKVDIWCPSCDSRSRHRLIQLWLDREAPVKPGWSVLHFAAEPWLAPKIRERAGEYVTADINDRFDIRLDIQAMDLPDARFDLIIANHVLEHVDDALALTEIARVLRPGGAALLTVPIIEGWDASFEDPGIADEARRTLVMGDPDHRRWYGRDIRDKIRQAGLDVAEYTANEPDVTTHALQRGEKLFIAAKPADPIA